MAEVSEQFIYNLTEFQFANMFLAANGGSTVFAVPEASENDDEKLAVRLKDELRQIQDLINMGLLEDVSDLFKEQLIVAKLNKDRGYIVVKLTALGKNMFHSFKGKHQWVN